ncbi:MAG: hypothetical protein TYPL_3330 [Candidatus Tyloplasma litorale]|nr:MAG: hypothetical protein TYPL_3330 [Mycoplasmatales bacterium]
MYCIIYLRFIFKIKSLYIYIPIITLFLFTIAMYIQFWHSFTFVFCMQIFFISSIILFNIKKNFNFKLKPNLRLINVKTELYTYISTFIYLLFLYIISTIFYVIICNHINYESNIDGWEIHLLKLNWRLLILYFIEIFTISFLILHFIKTINPVNYFLIIVIIITFIFITGGVINIYNNFGSVINEEPFYIYSKNPYFTTWWYSFLLNPFFAVNQFFQNILRTGNYHSLSNPPSWDKFSNANFFAWSETIQWNILMIIQYVWIFILGTIYLINIILNK